MNLFSEFKWKLSEEHDRSKTTVPESLNAAQMELAT